MNSYSHCSRMRRLAALALVLALASGLAASPSRAELARESRSVAGIDRVLLRTVGELEITQAADEALVVEAEPRVLRQITTAVSQGTLTIDTTGGGFSTREPVRFLLRVKRLAAIASTASGSVHTAALAADHLRLELAGSGDMRVDALTARTLAVEMPGAGSMEIGSGHVDQATLRVTGAAQYAGPQFRIRDARVDVDGSGDVVVAVEKSLAVTVRGSGRVGYRGDPVVTRKIDGAGSVEREGPQ